MKTTRFFMYGLIVLGILMLTGGATAVTMTLPLTQINIQTPTDINITLTGVGGANNTNITLVGAGVDMKGTSVGKGDENNSWVNFPGVTATVAGQITVTAVNASSGTTFDTATIQAGSSRRSRRYMVVSFTPEEPLINEQLTVSVVDKTREDALDDVEVDVFLAGKKVAYGLTDDDGLFMFKPTAAGDYLVQLAKTNYHDAEIEISVFGEAAATTTTTTTRATTTTQAATTTTMEGTTTTRVTTTRVTTPTTTPTTTPITQPTTPTTQPSEGGGLPLLWIAIIVVIILVVVGFFVMKGKGGAGAEEAPAKEEAPAAEAATEEEI
ncbi:MAG: hypothetical protein JW778_08420 [Candidatus Altiarchaeota archaeon]|nr:hypothetical protein [Candidatus Altiarchaeota archaeon]